MDVCTGVTLRDRPKVPTVEVGRRLGVEGVVEVNVVD